MEINGVHHVAGAHLLNKIKLAGSVFRQRVIAGIRGEVRGEGFISVEEGGLGPNFVGGVVVIVIRQRVGKLRQKKGAVPRAAGAKSYP